MPSENTTRQVDVEARRAKDDAILAGAQAELDAFERDTGKTVEVTIADSVAAGNCEAGVITWRASNASGRQSVPAQEMLQIAAHSRDQVSRAVLGVRKAIARMKDE